MVTLLIQRGELKVGDALVAGEHAGRARAMHDFRGERVKQATPGMPVEVLGFDGVPEAGEHFLRRGQRARGTPPRGRAGQQAQDRGAARRAGVRVSLRT